MVSSPDYPDPMKTAQAQGQMNQSTAITQQLMNMINQSGPNGSISYSQTGTNSYVDPLTGKTVTLPSYTMTTQLSPAQQRMLDLTNQFGIKADETGLAQLNRISGILSQPFNYTTSDHEKWAGGLYDSLNSDHNQQAADALEQRLAGQGLTPGSVAYDNAMRDMYYGQGKARDDFLLNSQQQGYNQALQTYNEPLNATSALMHGGQVNGPTQMNTPQTGVNGVDYAGLVNSKYQSELQQSNSMWGGLASLGSTLLGGWMMSDERLKDDIEPISETPVDGVDLYSFRYKGSPLQHVGFMAQEVEKKVPDAVATTPSGYKAVNYGRVLAAMGE